jgi:hypothetical protein
VRERRTQRTRYHSPPPEGDKRNGNIGRVSVWIEQLKELDQEAKRVWQHTEAGNEETPKVQAMIALEGNQDQDDEFDCVIQRQTKEYGNDNFEGEGIACVTCILVNYSYGRRNTSNKPPVIPAPAESKTPCAGVDSSGKAVSVELGNTLMESDAITQFASLQRGAPTHLPPKPQSVQDDLYSPILSQQDSNTVPTTFL